jgi:hypothetical protein
MDVIKRLRPGQPGTKRLQRRFGDRLLFVRYRHDARPHRRFTTVELIVDEGPESARLSAAPRRSCQPNDLVHLRVAFDETQLRAKVKAAGATWDPKRRRWSISCHAAQTSGLTDRIDPASDVQ